MPKNDASMRHPEDADAGAQAAGRALEWLGLSIVVALFIWLMWLFFVPAFFGAVDESAYLLEAKQLARTAQPVFKTSGPLAFTSENMLERTPGEFVAKYPPGYPLLCAAGYRIAGVKGAMFVNPLVGIAAVVGMFVLLRNFVSPMMALAGTMTLALHPMTLLYATGALSHMSETAFCIWGFAVALAWSKNGGALKAGLAVFLLAYACTIRYTAALVALPFLLLAAPRILMLCRGKKVSQLLTELGAIAAGAAAGLTPLLWYQWAAFGSPLATGYGLTHESVAFSWHWFTQHAWYTLVTLSRPGYGLVVLFPMAFAWLAYAAVKDRHRALFLGTWILPPLLLYMAYYWFPQAEHKSNYVRFFFQLFPPVIVAALLLVQRFSRRSETLDIAAASIIGLIALASFAFGGARKDLDRALPIFAQEASALVNRNLPPNTPVLCDIHLAYFAVVATDADIYSTDYFDVDYVRRFAGSMDPGGNQITDSLRARRLAQAAGGRSQKELDELLVQLLSQKAPRGMYLLTTPGRITLWKHRLGPTLDLTPVAQSPYEPILLRIKPANLPN